MALLTYFYFKGILKWKPNSDDVDNIDFLIQTKSVDNNDIFNLISYIIVI